MNVLYIQYIHAYRCIYFLYRLYCTVLHVSRHYYRYCIHYTNYIVCRGSMMVTTSDFQSGRLGSSPSRDHYSMRLDRGTGLIRALSLHPSGVVHRYQSGWTSRLGLRVCIDWISYHPECVCNSALITTFLQVQGWALTEYGDRLQSLANTPSLNNKFIQCIFFREWYIL